MKKVLVITRQLGEHPMVVTAVVEVPYNLILDEEVKDWATGALRAVAEPFVAKFPEFAAATWRASAHGIDQLPD